MSVFISICFLLQVLTEGFGQVYSGLVGQTDKDPQYICHFIGKVVFLSLLERLISVFACHHTCQFAYFLGQNGHIGQFAEVTYTIRFNPAVHFFCASSSVIIPCFGVHTYSNRTVVQKFNFHVCSEFSGSYFFAQTDAQFLAEIIIEGDGYIVLCSTDIGGTVAFFVDACSVNWLITNMLPPTSRIDLFMTPFSSSKTLNPIIFCITSRHLLVYQLLQCQPIS